jgi:predicted HicB family RNase H-like nuclease
MPQISVYIDEPTLRKIEIAAKRQKKSISKWVVEQIRSRI